MIKLWSELRGARLKEVAADLLTIVWVVFWGNIVRQLYGFLSSFTEAGRTVRAGGLGMVQSGQDLGDSLKDLPVVGTQARDLARDAFAGAGQPIADFGTELEQFIFVVSVVLAMLLAIVTIGPWLIRYLPWRAERLQRVRTAHRAIRKRPTSATNGSSAPSRCGHQPARVVGAARLHARPDRRLGRRPLRAARPRRARAGGAAALDRDASLGALVGARLSLTRCDRDAGGCPGTYLLQGGVDGYSVLIVGEQLPKLWL